MGDERSGVKEQKKRFKLGYVAFAFDLQGESYCKDAIDREEECSFRYRFGALTPTSSFPNKPIVSPAATIISITRSSDCALSR